MACINNCCCCSVTKLHPILCNSRNCSTPGFCLSLSPGVCSNSCPLSQWYHPTISSSVTPFSSCLQSFWASGFFPVSRIFASGGQSIGASASVLPVNIQGWFPSGLTGLILLSKGLSHEVKNMIVYFPILATFIYSIKILQCRKSGGKRKRKRHMYW